MLDSLRSSLECDIELDKVRWNESYSIEDKYDELRCFMSERVDYVDMDFVQNNSEYYIVNVDFGALGRAQEWHVQHGDSFHLPKMESYWLHLERIEDEQGQCYDYDFLPERNLYLFYRWRESTKMERLKSRIKDFISF
jgi:hypothetical protein